MFPQIHAVITRSSAFGILAFVTLGSRAGMPSVVAPGIQPMFPVSCPCDPGRDQGNPQRHPGNPAAGNQTQSPTPLRYQQRNPQGTRRYRQAKI